MTSVIEGISNLGIISVVEKTSACDLILGVGVITLIGVKPVYA